MRAWRAQGGIALLRLRHSEGRQGRFPGGELGSESVLVDLLRAEHRQLPGLEPPARRDRKGGQIRSQRRRDVLAEVGPGGGGVVDDHDGSDLLTQVAVRQPEYRGVDDAGHPDQRALDREGGDVLATAENEVLATAGDPKVTVLVEVAQVTGV